MKRERLREAGELPQEVKDYIWNAHSLVVYLLMGVGTPLILFGVIKSFRAHGSFRVVNISFAVIGGMLFLSGILLLIAVKGGHYTWRGGWVTGCTIEEHKHHGKYVTYHFIYIDGIKCRALSTQDYSEALNDGGRGIIIRFHFLLSEDFAIASKAAVNYMQ